MTGKTDSPAPPGKRHGAGTYQMLWDCRFCGTEKLLGLTHRHCPNCGAAQDPAWRYLPAEEDMVAVEDHKFVGADKLCPACSQPNSAASAFCIACGADLSGAAEAVVQAARFIGEGRAESDTKRDVVKDQFDAEMARVEALLPAKFLGLRKQSWFMLGAVALVALVIAGIVYAVTYRKEARGDVVGMTWERTVQIEDFQVRVGQGWDETVPGDAYGVSCERREHGTEQEKVGEREECSDVPQGDGTFRRECRSIPIYQERPVYDQWCSYRVDRWDHARTVEARGEWPDPAPAWPEVTLASGAGRFGQERESGRQATYTVVVHDADSERHTCDLDSLDEWMQYSRGTKVTLELYVTGGADCDTLKRVE